MKYDSDEISEAALLLATTKSAALPKSLEAELLKSADEFGSEVRFSTTKGAAVGMDNVIPMARARAKTPTWVWGAWAAAAAVIFVGVHSWKGAASTQAKLAAPVVEPSEWKLVNGAREAVATVARADGARKGTLAVLVPLRGPSRYQIWVSPSDREGAVSVGYFQCPESCKGQSFPLTLPIEPIRSLWLTQSDGVSSSLKDELTVLATGN